MASTETRTGFRLPWISDAHQADDAGQVQDGAEATGDADAVPAVDAAEPTAVEPTQATDGGADATSEAGPDTAPEPAPADITMPVHAEGGRRPTKFLADLARAMRTAAEAERQEILDRFQAEVKGFVETIHERSAVEATELRGSADGDIAAIRDWSKAEIARIREETEHRVGERKSLLEREIEDHAARIERQSESVHGTVGAFEGEMTRFFETLLAEEDPTRIAALASSLPEPPSLEAVAAAAEIEPPARPTEPEVTAEVTAEVAAEVAADDAPEVAPLAAAGATEAEPASGDVDRPATGIGEPVDAEAPAEAVLDAPEPSLEAATTATLEPTPTPEPVSGWSAEDLGEATGSGMNGAAMAAERETQPEAVAMEPAPDGHEATIADDEPAAEAHEPAAEAHAGFRGDPAFDEDSLAIDPRVAALGLTPDFDAAEAEAAADLAAAEIPDDGSGEEVPVIDEETIASRLAGLVPAAPAPADLTETRVIVSGLVSVASIAAFKRALGRLDGVHSVSVSSGPDGEFVFAVTRAQTIDLAGTIATMPGFAARIGGMSDAAIEVTAHDPDAA